MVCCPAPYEEILDHRLNGIIIRLVKVKIVLSSSYQILVIGDKIGHFKEKFTCKFCPRKSCEWVHKDPEIRFLSKARPMVWNPKFLMIFLLYFCIQVTIIISSETKIK